MADEPNEYDDLLTDEERAALAAEEGADIGEPTEGAQTWASEEERARAEADEAEAARQAEEAKAAEDAAKGEEGAEGAEGDPAPETDPAPEPAAAEEPVDNSAPDTTQIEAQIEALDGDAQKIMDDYEDGELSSEDMRKQLAELQGKRDDAVRQLAVAQDRVQQVEERWNGAVQGYLKENPGLVADQATLDQYDAMVRFVTANPAYANKSFDAQLKAAHRLLHAQADDLGLKDVPTPPGMAKPKEPDPEPKAQQQAKPAEPSAEDQRRAKELSTPPKTLARVPQADIPGAGEGEFAHLNRMIEEGADPEAVEAELAKLPQDQRDRFSSSVY